LKKKKKEEKKEKKEKGTNLLLLSFFFFLLLPSFFIMTGYKAKHLFPQVLLFLFPFSFFLSLMTISSFVIHLFFLVVLFHSSNSLQNLLLEIQKTSSL